MPWRLASEFYSLTTERHVLPECHELPESQARLRDVPGGEWWPWVVQEGAPRQGYLSLQTVYCRRFISYGDWDDRPPVPPVTVSPVRPRHCGGGRQHRCCGPRHHVQLPGRHCGLRDFLSVGRHSMWRRGGHQGTNNTLRSDGLLIFIQFWNIPGWKDGCGLSRVDLCLVNRQALEECWCDDVLCYIYNYQYNIYIV